MTTVELDLSARLAASLREPSKLPAPEPGVYENIPMSVYLMWNAVSNSTLQQLRRSPAHCKAYLEGVDHDTPALLLGRAIHCAILEPDAFPTRYVAGPEGDRRTKAVKDAWADVELRYGPDCVLSAKDYGRCISVRDAVYAHAAANALLAGAGRHELSIVWVDQDTGLTCKARIDRHVTGIARGFIVDVKSTRDASPDEFARSIEDYGYHAAAAHYLTGAQAVGLDAQHFAHIAVEKEPPFAVGTYRLVEGAIEAGDELIRGLLRLFAACKAANHWPAFSPQIEDVTLPDYAWQRTTDEVKALAKRIRA